NAERFNSSGCTAACCGAGPSSRVADDDGVDAAHLHLPRGIFFADQGVALWVGVDRQHGDVREVRLEHFLYHRQHAIGLPLLVADEPDALALERGQPRGVRLRYLERTGRVVEFQLYHWNLLHEGSNRAHCSGVAGETKLRWRAMSPVSFHKNLFHI